VGWALSERVMAHPAETSGVRQVFTLRTPFQIRGRSVVSVAVDVIDVRLVLRIRNKRQSDEPMNHRPPPPTIDGISQVDARITILAIAKRQFSGLIPLSDTVSTDHSTVDRTHAAGV